MSKCVNCGYDADSPLDVKKITHDMQTYFDPESGKVYGTLNSADSVIKVKGKEYVTAEELEKRSLAKKAKVVVTPVVPNTPPAAPNVPPTGSLTLP